MLIKHALAKAELKRRLGGKNVWPEKFVDSSTGP